MNPPLTILAIELSTPRGKLAVVRGEEVLYESEFTSHRSHNAQLFQPLRDGLAAAGTELDLVVVGTGPGSYTGVRISIASAQGISMTRDIPVIGLPSVLTPEGTSPAETFCIVGDARRDGYFAITIQDGSITDEGIQVLTAPDLQNWLLKRQNLPIFTYDQQMVSIAPATLTTPSAVQLAKRAQLNAATTQEIIEPIYLRDAFITVAKRPWARV